MVRELDRALIERLTEEAIADLASSEAPGPAALTFLLRRYGVTGRDDLQRALEPALDHALAQAPGLERAAERARWLVLFTEASAMSDTAALRETAVGLAACLRREWPRAVEVDAHMRSIDACLAATPVIGAEELSGAVDELERVVGTAYRPGEGMAHEISSRRFERGRLSDQVSTARSLLTAYTLTGRLPYAMLAEELMRSARRVWWDDRRDGFCDVSLVENCEAAQVLVRLSVLLADADYRGAAVVGADADYMRDAERTLAARVGERGEERAIFGLTLDELLRWRSTHC